jgi:hypothetical protein
MIIIFDLSLTVLFICVQQGTEIRWPCNTRECQPFKCRYKGRQDVIQGVKSSSLIFPILHSSSPPEKRRMLPFSPVPKQYGNKNRHVVPEALIPRKTGKAF